MNCMNGLWILKKITFMDKTFALMMVGGFCLPTIWMTVVSYEAIFKGFCRNKVCRNSIVSLTLMMWFCIIGLLFIIIYY